MTQNTPFLGMKLYNSTTDGSALFLTYRTDMAGISSTSNFNVLDTFASSTSASLIALQARSIYLASAVYVSPNYYEANSVSGVTAYVTNMYIDLYVDTTNVGLVTLNINSLGTKTLKKVDLSGNLADLSSGDLEKNKEYLFRYNGTYFVWVAVSSGTSTTSISGSSIMSDTTGSIVKHNASGAVPGSYLAANVTIDSFGHITTIANGASASSTGAPVDSPFLTSGSAASLTNYSVLTAGSNIAITRSGSVTTIDSTASGTTSISGSGIMSDSSGSIVKHNVSGVVSGSYNQVQVDVFGHVISASNVSAGTTYAGSALIIVSGSKISHDVGSATVGSYLSANVTVDEYGHITNISNGTSASSVGAPSDSPYIVSGSVSGLTNAKQMIAGSNISITPSGSTLIVATTISGTVIDGSSVMSSTTGSTVKHNSSGVSSGSYNKVQVDVFGHVTSASVVLMPITATQVSGKALDSYNSTTGSFTNIPIPITATGVSGRALYSYTSTTGSFANVAIPLSGSGAGKAFSMYDATTGSFTNSYLPITATNVAGRVLNSYSSTTGSFTNIPIPITSAVVSNKALASYDSTTGSFTNTTILAGIAGSSVMSNTTGSQIKHNYSGITAGSYTQMTVDSFGHAISGCQVPVYVKTVEFQLNGSTALTVTDKGSVRIPSYMEGWVLTEAAANCSASSTSGSPSFTLKRNSASSIAQVSLLNNVITIDASEYDSSTSASAVSISTLNVVHAGDRLEGACAVAGTGVTNAVIEATFRAL